MTPQSERRVKIVATLGPAVSSRETLRALLSAGVNVARINAAHGKPEERSNLINDIRAVAAEEGLRIPILFDLQGCLLYTSPSPRDS